MVKVEVSILELKNEISQIQSTVSSLVHLSDNERRDGINLLVEKLRTLSARLNANPIEVVVK